MNSIKHKINYFKVLGIFVGDTIVGCGIIEKHTGDIPQFAISKKQRINGFATILFKKLIVYSETGRYE